MAQFTQPRKFINNVWWRFLSVHYARHCQQVGSGFLVKSRIRLRNAGRVEIGANCLIDSSWAYPVRLDVGKDANLRFGSQVYINEGVHITCNIGITIGNRCLIAPDVVILDDDGHPTDWRHRHDYWPDGPETRFGAPIVIEDNVWLGTRAIILKGVTIGLDSVVAAGAVVVHSVPPKTVVGGSPAKVIYSLEDAPIMSNQTRQTSALNLLNR